MMLNYKIIESKLRELNMLELLESSAIRSDDNFYKILRILKPKPEIIIEIGTYRGISTLLLASIGIKVYTFDIVYQSIAKKIWEAFGLHNKIKYVIVNAYKKGYSKKSAKEIEIHKLINEGINHAKANQLIKKFLIDNKVKADFAFIDSRHKKKEVSDDFDIVKYSGRVLFDDVVNNYPGVVQFTKSINAVKIYEFGYWETGYEYPLSQ